MGQVKKEKEKREIKAIAIDIARVMDDTTLLTMCQAFMMQNLVQKIEIELVPPIKGATKKDCFIKYQIVPFGVEKKEGEE